MKELLAFDIYQRYNHVAQIVRGLAKRRSVTTILDVGGQQLLLAQFLKKYRIVVADRAPESAGEMVAADGVALPFKDSCFDIVVSVDTLEHVPTQARQKFLEETNRVASTAVIIAFPDGSEAVENAEDLVRRYAVQLTKMPHDYLDEHKRYGLPNRDFLREYCAKNGLHLVLLDNGYLPRWLLAMAVSLALSRLSGADALLKSCNELYNRHWYPKDLHAPSYRCVAVLSREPLSELELMSSDSTAGEKALSQTAIRKVMEQCVTVIDQQDQTLRYLRELEKATADQAEQIQLHQAAAVSLSRQYQDLEADYKESVSYARDMEVQLQKRGEALNEAQGFAAKLEGQVSAQEQEMLNLEDYNEKVASELKIQLERNASLEESFKSRALEFEEATRLARDHIATLEDHIRSKDEASTELQLAYEKIEREYWSKQQQFEIISAKMDEVTAFARELENQISRNNERIATLEQAEYARQVLAREFENLTALYSEAVSYVRKLEQVEEQRGRHVMELEGYIDHLLGEITRLQQG